MAEIQQPAFENSASQIDKVPLPPLPLAEQLGTVALGRQLEGENNNTEDWRESTRSLRKAWAEVEMSLSVPDHIATDHHNNASTYLQGIFTATDVDAATQFDASILEAYMGNFSNRSRKVSPSDRQRTLAHRILAGGFEKIDAMPVHESEKRGFRTKMGLHLLLSRSGLNYYPASSRESKNRNSDYAFYNHDGYVIMDGKKVPIKSRGSNLRKEEYADQVLFLPFKRLAHKSLTATTGAQTVSGKFAEHGVHLLAQEAHGEELNGYERRWIDHLTQSVTGEIEAFAQEN